MGFFLRVDGPIRASRVIELFLHMLMRCTTTTFEIVVGDQSGSAVFHFQFFAAVVVAAAESFSQIFSHGKP